MAGLPHAGAFAQGRDTIKKSLNEFERIQKDKKAIEDRIRRRQERLNRLEAEKKKAGIIDPAKVARVALENAASVAGLFLTTESVICDKPAPEPAMPMGGAPGMGGMM